MDRGGAEAAGPGDPPEGTQVDVPPSPEAPPSHQPTYQPTLPKADTAGMPTLADHRSITTPPGSTWYRSDQQRSRSVYRRANPWYRRLMRGLIGLSILGAVGIGVYIGGTQLSDYLNRDKLPSAGSDVPAFRSTAFLITSEAPAPDINGVLTIDTVSAGFEFKGAAGTPQAGVEVVSPDGSQMFLRTGGGDWRAAGDESITATLKVVVPYLLAIDGVDDVLDNQMRRGYVDLVKKTVLGHENEATARDRYEMLFDTRNFAVDHPVQWEDFQHRVIPGVSDAAAVTLAMVVDDDNVVVGFEDEQTKWAWERLAYEETAFDPDPGGAIAARVGATATPAG